MARPRKQQGEEKKPKAEGPKEPKREFSYGFRWGTGYGKHKDDKPLDFVGDRETGLRPGENRPPFGTAKHDLRNGIKDSETIVPWGVWKQGKYLSELPDKQAVNFRSLATKAEEWHAYIVSGEGSPGNYAFRLYLLPTEVATPPDPLHPEDWPEQLKKEKKAGQHGYTHYGYGSPWATTPTVAPATKPGVQVTKAASLPTNLRFRCPGCGHWFKEADLSKHVTHACPGVNGEDHDWAIMCECCHELDRVAVCKPGFPREKKEEPKKKEEVAADGSNGDGVVRPTSLAETAGA